jgi:hypothetical protein
MVVVMMVMAALFVMAGVTVVITDIRLQLRGIKTARGEQDFQWRWKCSSSHARMRAIFLAMATVRRTLCR